MSKQATGRMINQDISMSKKISRLTPRSLSLFCLLIPHFNAHGKMLANPMLVKGLVCPLIDWLTPELIQASLIEISDKTNVKFWSDEKGIHYIHSLNWKEHQEIRADRLGPDRLPDYPGLRGINPELSGLIPLEVEVEVEGKEEDKTFSASLDAGQENEDFYLTAKKRKLTGERLTTFNQFMDTFGDKRGRAQAADVWIDLKITRKVFDDIIRGAERYAKQRTTIQAQGHTPKMAQGWLSGRRWEDEQPEAQRKLEVCL